MDRPFELGQVVFWVNNASREQSGTVVGWSGADTVCVDVSDDEGPLTLPFYTNEVFPSLLQAWQARQAAVKARALSARETLASMLSEHSRASNRIAELRSAVMAEVL